MIAAASHAMEQDGFGVVGRGERVFYFFQGDVLFRVQRQIGRGEELFVRVGIPFDRFLLQFD